MGPGAGHRHGRQATFSFVAQVRLADASLVTFDTRQPPHTASWPYRLLLSLGVLLAADGCESSMMEETTNVRPIY